MLNSSWVLIAFPLVCVCVCVMLMSRLTVYWGPSHYCEVFCIIFINPRLSNCLVELWLLHFCPQYETDIQSFSFSIISWGCTVMCSLVCSERILFCIHLDFQHFNLGPCIIIYVCTSNKNLNLGNKFYWKKFLAIQTICLTVLEWSFLNYTPAQSATLMFLFLCFVFFLAFLDNNW